jgi:hypothetical protein
VTGVPDGAWTDELTGDSYEGGSVMVPARSTLVLVPAGG